MLLFLSLFFSSSLQFRLIDAFPASFDEVQSGVQLSAAAIQADIEDNKADNRATLEGLEELGLRASRSLLSFDSFLSLTFYIGLAEEAKGIDAAIDALWMKEEGEGNDDGGEGTV